jgi:hypothetical protein
MANDLPVQGTPGIFDYRNPTLLPNFDKPTQAIAGSGVLSLDSPAIFLAANPRVDATDTVTVGGTPASGNVFTITITNSVFKNSLFGGTGTIAHSYTSTGSDTLATIAEALADAFNDDANAQAAGLRADTGGTSGAVITFHHAGLVGNLSVATESVTGGSMTLTLGNSGVFAGGSGPILVGNNFTYARGGQVQAYWYGQPYLLDFPTVSAMVTDGMPIT